MRRTDPIVVCLYVAITVLPVTAMVGEWRDHRLTGALVPAPRPELRLDAIRSEVYQSGFAAWFESELGLRNWSIWIDNTVLYHVFDETKFGSQVAIGYDDTLFVRDDVSYFNKTIGELPAPDSFDKMAEQIAALQHRLQREHRAVVPMFVPSKTTVYPDKMPPLWTRDLGMPRPSTERIYHAMKRALDAHGVVYVDGIDIITTSKEPRSLLWGPSARHFSLYAACLCTREVLRRSAELAGAPPSDYPCQVEVRRAKRSHRDLDLHGLLNAWRTAHDPILRDTRHEPLPEAPPPGAPRILWLGTSFGFAMMEDAVGSRRFAEAHLDYYNTTVLNGVTGIGFDATQHDKQWRSIFASREIYVLELFETYVSPSDFVAIEAINAALDDAQEP